MTPLSAVLAEACSKMKPALDPARCSLLLNKKPLDLSLPFRLANIPNGSSLILHGGWCNGWGIRLRGTAHSSRYVQWEEMRPGGGRFGRGQAGWGHVWATCAV